MTLGRTRLGPFPAVQTVDRSCSWPCQQAQQVQRSSAASGQAALNPGTPPAGRGSMLSETAPGRSIPRPCSCLNAGEAWFLRSFHQPSSPVCVDVQGMLAGCSRVSCTFTVASTLNKPACRDERQRRAQSAKPDAAKARQLQSLGQDKQCGSLCTPACSVGVTLAETPPTRHSGTSRSYDVLWYFYLQACPQHAMKLLCLPGCDRHDLAAVHGGRGVGTCTWQAFACTAQPYPSCVVTTMWAIVQMSSRGTRAHRTAAHAPDAECVQL